ncbi:unnamed protein product [Phytophthora fragariaefolia]|uniref:Unnamed protein product n=1 Tax=Phytophthora fragariaefolia TaxID=1490495 RepID=A0A9W6U8F3_9STRA|nr:unnamed protein product [Phytophthora fragariaefolia]
MPILSVVVENARELQQFLCAINWMRDSTNDFARQVEPLQRRLDAAFVNTKRTKRAAASISIDLEDAECQAFDQVKDALANAATLEFPDGQVTTRLFTDVSDVGYAIIVTQVANFDSNKPATEQQLRLVHCARGTFTGSQLNWTVIEKGAFPIAVACDKLDYLLLRPKSFGMYLTTGIIITSSRHMNPSRSMSRTNCCGGR